MWLDRLAGGPASASGPSTPQPGSRPYSPVPRRTSSTLSPYVTSQRGGPSPRGSTLSLVSNDSTSSLLSSSRKPNGSNLKQTSTVETGPDSLEVLEKLLGTSSHNKGPSRTRDGHITEDDLEFDADFGGLSLKQLAASGTPETTASCVRRPQSAEDSRIPGKLLSKSRSELNRR